MADCDHLSWKGRNQSWHSYSKLSYADLNTCSTDETNWSAFEDLLLESPLTVKVRKEEEKKSKDKWEKKTPHD